MEQGATCRISRYSLNDQRVVAICLALVAIVSPLYIDRRKEIEPEPEPDESCINFSSYLPVLLLILIMAIAVSCYLDRSFTRFDPYWIHRVGGSSTGIIIVLLILALVLRCKYF